MNTPTPVTNPFDLLPEELESLGQLLHPANGAMVKAPVGKLVKARFLSAQGRNFYFDIGEKEEGICPSSEFPEMPAVGEEFSIIVLERNQEGIALLSRKAAQKKEAWDAVIEAEASETSLSGEILRQVAGGYLLSYGPLKLFMPMSHSQPYVQAAEGKYLSPGHQIDFRVLELKTPYYSAVVSHTRAIEERNNALWDQFSQSHKVGDIVEGIVIKRVSFGVFLEVEGLAALLHVNDVSWRKKPPLKNKFHLKSRVKAKILAIDRENNRINVGLKQLKDEPWTWAAKELAVGKKTRAKVLKLTKFGAFMELQPGLEGLLHLSEVSWSRKLKHPQERLKQGQKIEVQVLSMDIEKKRLTLSLKRLQKDPWEAARKEIKAGDICTGKITGVQDFGVFVRLCKGVDGLLHSKEYSWNKDGKKDMFQKDQEIRVKILDINWEERRITCSHKQLQDSPHTLFQKEHPIGSLVEGTVKDRHSYGVIVQLPNQLEALIPKSATGVQITDASNIEEHFPKGSAVKAVVKDIDLKRGRIYLSLKDYEKHAEKAAAKQYLVDNQHEAASRPFAALLQKEEDKS